MFDTKFSLKNNMKNKKYTIDDLVERNVIGDTDTLTTAKLYLDMINSDDYYDDLHIHLDKQEAERIVKYIGHGHFHEFGGKDNDESTKTYEALVKLIVQLKLQCDDLFHEYDHPMS